MKSHTIHLRDTAMQLRGKLAAVNVFIKGERPQINNLISYCKETGERRANYTGSEQKKGNHKNQSRHDKIEMRKVKKIGESLLD
jgi:hypothetical protein